MSDIFLKAELTADAGPLISEVRGSKGAVEQLDKAQDGLAASARSLATATTQSGAATAEAAREARSLAQAAASAAVAEQQLADAERRTGAATTALATQQARVTAGMGAQRAGAVQLGQQLQDVSIQYSMGTAAGMIFAQQSGQIIGALALMSGGADGAKGKMAALASFMGGPWGVALGVAVTLAGALANELMKADTAAKTATLGASGLSSAQSVLGEMFDLTTGKIKSQNDLLIINARLMALNLRSEAMAQQASSKKIFGSSGDMSWTQRGRSALGPVLPGAYGNWVAGDTYGTHERQDMLRAMEAERGYIDNIKDDRQRWAALSDFTQRAGRQNFDGLGITREQYLTAVADDASAKEKKKLAKLVDESLSTGTLAEGLRRDAPTKKGKKDNSAEKAAREAKQLAEFGGRAEESIARLNDQFNRAPQDIDKARQATAQLDDVIKDLGARKPPNFQALIAQAQALKPLIAESLARPIREMIGNQERQIALGDLQVRGRQSEAQALQLTYSLMDKLGVESEDQLATALAQRGIRGDEARQLYDNLGVMREQTRELARQQDRQQAVLDLINNAEESMTAAIANLRSQGPAAFGDAVKSVMGGLDQLFAQRLTDALFGDLFDDLRDQATGADKVSKAGDRIAVAVDKAAGTMDKTAKALDALGKSASGATDRLNGKPAPNTLTIADAGPAAAPATAGNDEEVMVMGQRLRGGPFVQGYKDVTDGLSKSIKSTFSDIFGDKGLFSDSLSTSLGQILGGAQVGASLGSSISKSLGLGGSSTGGAIGGAIGQQAASALFGAAAGPLGALAGGVLGSVVGGLFKTTKYASTSFSASNGAVQQSSSGGNTAQYDKQLNVLGDSFTEGLKSIAEQLGGSVTGPISTSIGMRKGEIRVDTSGTGKTKGGTVTDFYDDSAGAIKFALQDALGDGAVQGLSSAVAKALRSSSDLDSALAEALKVRDIEQLLSGTGSALEKELRSFESQAKERVRIATQYGFDVIRIEEKNATERKAIIDDFVTGRVGSLQDMLKDLEFGDLFEGSIAEQRTALLSEIATARTRAADGEDGAADTLTELSRKLIEVSREGYGTAGPEYAADRASAISNAEAVIKAENDRAKAAMDAALATNAKLDEGNALANEGNDLLAQISGQLASLSGGGASGGAVSGVNVSRVALL